MKKLFKKDIKVKLSLNDNATSMLDTVFKGYFKPYEKPPDTKNYSYYLFLEQDMKDFANAIIEWGKELLAAGYKEGKKDARSPSNHGKTKKAPKQTIRNVENKRPARENRTENS